MGRGQYCFTVGLLLQHCCFAVALSAPRGQQVAATVMYSSLASDTLWFIVVQFWCCLGTRV